MSTLTNETTLGGVPLENSKNSTLPSSKEDKHVKGEISPLTPETIEKIQDSISDKPLFTVIRLLVENPEDFVVTQNQCNWFIACEKRTLPNGDVILAHDPSILVVCGENNFILYRDYFYQSNSNEELEKEQKQNIGETIFFKIKQQPEKSEKAGKITGMLLEMPMSELLDLMKDESALNSKIEEAIEVLKEAEEAKIVTTEVNTEVFNELEEKYNSLSSEYSINLSEEKIRELTILCIKLALFKKSIVLSNGSENPVHSDVINRILEEVKSKSFIPNKIFERIIEFLNFIINRVIPNPSLVYKGYSGPRSIENLKSILQHLNLTIPPHPKLNGKILSLKDERFPYRYYGEELKNVIINSLNDDSKLISIGLLVSLWDQTDGLQVFLDEVSNM
jgi:hypothetical protein